MAGKQGHNVIKGKQGFQPTYTPPPSSLNLPTHGGGLTTHPAGGIDMFKYHQLQTCALVPPQSYIDQYSWQDVVLYDTPSQPGAPGLTPEGLADKYGGNLALAAYRKPMQKHVDALRRDAEGKPLSEQITMISESVPTVEAMSRIIVNAPEGSHDTKAVEAAKTIIQGSGASHNVNNAVIELTPDEDAPDGQSAVYTQNALRVMKAADESMLRTLEKDTLEYQNAVAAAANHRSLLANPYAADAFAGTLRQRAPRPSEDLVQARKARLQKSWERDIWTEGRGGIDWFGRSKKQLAQINQELATLTAKQNQLENL